MSKNKFVQGNEAITKGAIYAGANFYAGYPITPSTEIAETASRELMLNGGIFIQMEDEISSMAAIIGGALAGKKAFTATSGPGFSLMQENLGFAEMTEIPCVIVDAERSGPSTGLATKPAQADIMQARWGRHGDQAIIVLSPANIQESFELTVKAFNLAETYRTPVVLLVDEEVAHLHESLTIDDSLEVVKRKHPTCSPNKYLPYEIIDGYTAPLAEFGSEYIMHINGSMHNDIGDFSGSPENCEKRTLHLSRKIYDHLDDILMAKELYCDDCDMLIITFGSTTRSAHAAVLEARSSGMKVGLLQLQTIWPFNDKQISKFAKQVKKILVPEMNLGQLANEIRRVVGKEIPVYQMNKTNSKGITPEEILSKVKEVY